MTFGLIGVSLLFLLTSFGMNLIYVTCTFVYPAYKSFKAIESSDEKDDKRWLSYWIVFGFMHCFDSLISTLFSFIPFFGLIRLALLVFLSISKEHGSKLVYDLLINPVFMKFQHIYLPAVQWFEEIAQITSTNLGTVKSRLSRGRARMREVLRAGELLPARYRLSDGGSWI